MRLTRRTFGRLVVSLVQLGLHLAMICILVLALLVSPFADLVVWSRGGPRRLRPPRNEIKPIENWDPEKAVRTRPAKE